MYESETFDMSEFQGINVSFGFPDHLWLRSCHLCQFDTLVNNTFIIIGFDY